MEQIQQNNLIIDYALSELNFKFQQIIVALQTLEFKLISNISNFRIQPNIKLNSMNPFQKLKHTIDRIGLQYIPSNDRENITGQTVYKYSRTNQLQQSESLPYFKTQGPNEQSFKRRSAEFRAQEIQQLRSVFQNQQKNLVQQINTLNQKLNQSTNKYQTKCYENDRLNSELESCYRQNKQLKACIVDLEHKSARKMSQSGVVDRQRKFKQQIDRVNFTVAELARELNAQKSLRKNLQKQLQQQRLHIKQTQQKILMDRRNLQRQIELLKEELQNRVQLLQHSIKSSRDSKMEQRKELSESRQKYELKIESIRYQLLGSREDIYKLKNQLTEMRFQRENLRKQINKLSQLNESLSNQLKQSKQATTQLEDRQKSLSEKLQQMKLQLVYYQQQLQDERSNTRVKVVQVRDESLEMELNMYKQQCRQLGRERTIWESLKKDKSEYTIVSENQLILNNRNN